MEKKSVLYIGGFELPDKNAAAQRVIANANLLREMGFEVSFIGISKDLKNAPSMVDGFLSTPVTYPIGTKQWIHHISTFVDAKIILERKPDYVILYNFPAIASLKILRACHRNGVKVVHDLTEWESNNGWSPSDIMRKIDINLRMRYCMKKMDGVIAISKYLYDYYKQYTNTIFVPPTVDLNDAKWNRERVLERGDTIKLVYAGSAGFGLKDRLDTIVKSVIKFPNIQFDIIGMTQEQYEVGYGHRVERYQNITFHGRIPHQEAVKAVQNADFQFLIRDSSLKNNAGFPTKFVESFACCTPVIATLTSNIADYLTDGYNGFVVDDNRTLDNVLQMVSQLTEQDIVQMKKHCRECRLFDYREYRSTFEQMFR